MNGESLESLWAYCTQDDRVVPMPGPWTRLHQRLRNVRQKPTGGWEPPLPLILSAWHDSSDEDKRQHLRLHLLWAEQQGQLDEVAAFLRALTPSDWCHAGEA